MEDLLRQRMVSAVAACRREWAVGLVLLFGLAVRVAWLFIARPEPVSDFAGYLQAARNLMIPGGLVHTLRVFDIYYFPGTPVFLSLMLLISQSQFWLSLGMVALSSLGAFLVWALALRLTGDRTVSLVACFVYAVLPHLVMFSSILATEHLFTVLMLMTLLFALRRTELRWGRAAFLGLVLGAAILTRGDGLFYLPVVLGVLYWFRREPRRKRVRNCAVMLVALSLVVGAWYAKNAILFSPSVGLSGVSGLNLYYGHNPDHYGWWPESPLIGLPAMEANRLGFQLGLDYIRAHPASMFDSAAVGTRLLYSSSTYAYYWSAFRAGDPATIVFEPRVIRGASVWYAIVDRASVAFLVLAALAALSWPFWPSRLKFVVLGTVVTNWVGFTVVSHAKPRFRYFVDVILTIAVAFLAVRVARAFGRRVGDRATRRPQ